MSKHFHEEWSFRVVYTKNGQEVGQQRFCARDNRIFDTEKRARSQMEVLCGLYSAMLNRTGEGVAFGKAFDAYEIYTPVRRIVTEWEDCEEEVK